MSTGDYDKKKELQMSEILTIVLTTVIVFVTTEFLKIIWDKLRPGRRK